MVKKERNILFMDTFITKSGKESETLRYGKITKSGKLKLGRAKYSLKKRGTWKYK